MYEAETEERAPLALRSSQVLPIAFVRVAGGAVSGTLDSYTDPDCKCTVQAGIALEMRSNLQRFSCP